MRLGQSLKIFLPFLFLVLVLIGYHYHIQTSKRLPIPIGAKLKLDERDPDDGPNTKYILFWNAAYWSKDYGVCCGRKPFKHCKVKDCHVTDNRMLLNDITKYRVIQFHPRTHEDLGDIPSNRHPNQRYLMWLMESPAYPYGSFDPPHEFKNFFNWTLTYRKDSDFPFPYGKVVRTKNVPVDIHNEPVFNSFLNAFGNEHKELVRNKTKPAAVFMSNCDAKSNRQGFIEKLSEHIEVDVYGDCGTLTCPKSEEMRFGWASSDECWKKIEDKYFFYLSLENSLCKDYITEKFFDAMKWNILPVTLGGNRKNNYAELSGAPAHSFIDANRKEYFENPKALADYLKQLMADPNEYAKYFWWKGYFQSTKVEPMQNYCDVCEKLHDPSTPQKEYKDMKDWWREQAECYSFE